MRRGIGSKDNNEIKPALREEIARVEVNDGVTVFVDIHNILEIINNLVVVHNESIEVLIATFVQFLFGDDLAQFNVSHLGMGGNDGLSQCRLSSSRSSSNENVGHGESRAMSGMVGQPELKIWTVIPDLEYRST